MIDNRPVPREAVLIVNAHSRKGQALFRHAREKLIAAGVRLIAAHAVRNPKDLNPTVQQAVKDGAAMVIVGGGDGSLSCTVDFVVDHDVVFALLPLGTANSFARTLGIPLDLDGAIDVIARGRRQRIDLGMIDGDYFANCCAIGLSPKIGDSVPHNLKKYLGRIGYLMWAVWCLIKFRSFKLTVDDGTESHTMRALEVRIANGRFHGGVEMIDDAGVDSGEIVVQAVMGHYRTTLMWNWLATMLRLPARHETTREFHGKRMEITTRPPLSISIDGEVLARTPAVAEVAKRAIEVVVPQGPLLESSP